jgi:hypothetical protein
MRPLRREISNTDLCMWAMYLLSAHIRPVDVEDIYLKLFEVAPEKFSWRTRSDLPNMRNGLTALGKLEKDLYPEFVIKASPTTRMLSDLGLRWIEANREKFEGLGNEQRVMPSRQDAGVKQIRQLQESRSWSTWQSGLRPDLEQLADAFSCSPSSSRATWESRLNSALQAAEVSGVAEVKNFIQEAREIVEKEI